MRIYNQKNHSGQGFTLLELLIVMSVLAILLSWGMPSLQTSIRNNTVLAQTNDLIAILHFAKSEALRRNSDVWVELDNKIENEWKAFVSDPEEAVDTANCPPGLLRCASHTSVVLIKDVPEAGQPDVKYNNRGYIRSEDEAWAPETFFIQHAQCEGNSQRRRIDITATGQISSCSLPCDSTATCS